MNHWILLVLMLGSCHAGDNTKTLTLPSKTKSTDFDKAMPSGIDTSNCGFLFKKEKNYLETKSSIVEKKAILYAMYLKKKSEKDKAEFLDSVSVFLSNSIVNRIIPYWYGTPWEFTGHTAVPNEGTIACGYFVSTTLKDAGFNLNRYTLAQQNPENEAKSVAIDLGNMETYSMTIPGTVKGEIKHYSDGLYFVGLDSHVGYLWIKNKTYYFIHSNYIANKVQAEKTSESIAFFSFKYHISKITGNRRLTLKWLKSEAVEIVLT